MGFAPGRGLLRLLLTRPSGLHRLALWSALVQAQRALALPDHVASEMESQGRFPVAANDFVFDLRRIDQSIADTAALVAAITSVDVVRSHQWQLTTVDTLPHAQTNFILG